MTWRPPDKIPRAALSPHLKRYGWLRLYNDFTSHPKWRAVATACGLPLHEVVTVALACLLKGNVGVPRGSLAEFSMRECAAGLDLPPDHVARIYSEMESAGWIDNDFLVTWDERQPDREDPTNAERQRRYKARRKAERDAARNAVTSVTVTRHAEIDETVTRHGTVTDPVTPSVTHRDDRHAEAAVTVTIVTPETVTETVTRHDASRSKDPTAADRARRYRANRKKKVAPPTRNAVTSVSSRPDETRSIQAGDSNQPVNFGENAAEWLAVKGLETVMAAGRLGELAARIRLARWRADAADDEALRELIHTSAALTSSNVRFLGFIGQGVARLAVQRATGTALPLPPVTVRRNA